MKRLLTILFVLLLSSGRLFAQTDEGVEPQEGPPGTEITITLGAVNETCTLQTEDSPSADGVDLEPIEVLDDLTFITRIPDNVTVGTTYYIYCGFGFEFRGLTGTFTVTPSDFSEPVQPEEYFRNVQLDIRPGSMGALQRIGQEWVVDVEFENASSQNLNLRVRGANRNRVRSYAESVQLHFESIPYSASFSLNADRATNQTPGRLTTPADISVDLTLLSAGDRVQGLANYITYFHIDPTIQGNEKHDYLVTNQEAAAARANSEGAPVRLTMWRTSISPRYANSDTTVGDGQTIFLKHSAVNQPGNYAARIVNESETQPSIYSLDGTFGERVCPPLDAGCDSGLEPPSGIVYALIDHPDMDCGARRGLLNVRTGPGVEYGIVSRLLVCDPVAIVGRNQASNGRWWVQLLSSQPRWINIAFTDFDGNIEDIPLSSEWTTQTSISEIQVGDGVSGRINDEYGATHFFESTSSGYIIGIEADAPGTLIVVVGGTHYRTYDFSQGTSQFSLSTNATGREHSFIVRFNEGATGGYMLTVNSQS